MLAIFIIVLLYSLIVLRGLAERSYKITEYRAQVKLLENGDMQVSEILEYDFSGDFNGILRSIGIRGSDGFEYFKAWENFPETRRLEFTQSQKGEMITYQIYDKSSNQRKSFLLEYQLKNVVTLYQDTGEFYWKFFDESNTSPIGYLRIELELPDGEISPEQIKIFGHGPLNGKVFFQDDGKIVYEVDQLPSATMVEARILFPPQMFPYSRKIVNQNKFEDIMKEELKWAEETERGKSFNLLAILMIPIAILFNIFLAIRLYFKYDKELKPEREIDYYRELPQDLTPAVLSNLMFVQGTGTKDIIATLMDLVRKKYLKVETISGWRKKEYKFSLIESDLSKLKEHEAYLITWLFYSIGDGKNVSLKEIKDYAKSSRTQSNFRHNYQQWVTKVKKEFKKYNYFGESKEGLKSALKIILLELAFVFLLLFVGFVLGIKAFWLIPVFFVVLFSGLGVIIYAALIRKKTQIGINEYTKWNAFKRFLLHFSNMKDYEIPSIAVWEHYLVYAISLGIAEKVISQLRIVLSNQNITMGNSTYLFHMTDSRGKINSSMFKSFHNTFSTAFIQATAASTGSGGGFSSGGGGGGGGGGAGAF
ncbi:MAG: DUF2207 domain-containing protein [Candidatus Caldatribacteriota bacterium]